MHISKTALVVERLVNNTIQPTDQGVNRAGTWWTNAVSGM